MKKVFMSSPLVYQLSAQTKFNNGTDNIKLHCMYIRRSLKC